MKSSAQKPRKFVIFNLIAIFTFIIILMFTYFNPFQERIEIAFVSSLSNLDEVKLQAGKNNVDAINLYFKSINESGGINGKKVFLSVYDDQAKPEIALEMAQKIVRSKAVAVIGHRTSQLTLAASKAYQEYSMPVVNPENTADELTDFKWFFRTTFSNRIQSVLIANYANKVLKYSKATIVRGDDVYGTNLGTQVLSRFKELGGEVVDEWIIGKNFKQDIQKMITSLKSKLDNSKSEQSKLENPQLDQPTLNNSKSDQSQLDNIRVDNLRIEQAEKEQNPNVLIAAMPYDRAVEFIQQLRQANINLPVVAGNTFSDLAIADYFKNTEEAKKDQDFFTKDIFAFTPIIFDVLEDEGQRFKTEFEKEFKRELTWQGIAYHDASMAIVESLKASDINKKNTSELRDLVIQGFRKFNSPSTAFRGAGRSIYFDKKGDALTPAYVSLFDHHQLISAFAQLSLVKENVVINNLAKKIENGEIIKIGDRYLQKVNIVYVGMDINKVNDIDESKSSYIVDFYLWFRYQGNLPIEEIDFTNYNNNDSSQKLSLSKPIQEGTDDKVNYKIYHINAEFAENFDFRHYPFDKQTLSIKFRHQKLTRNHLIYATDLVGMRGANPDKIVEQAKRIGVFDGISSWILNKVEFFQNTDIENSTFGHRYLLDGDSDIRYSQFNASIELKRDVSSFTIKNLLPLLFFIMIAYLLMFLPFDAISIEAVSGLLLAVVFYHLNLTDKLPKTIGYTVLLDYAFYVVYILLALQLFIIVLGNNETLRSLGLQNTQLMHWGRIAFPSIIVISSAVIFWLAF